MDQAWLDAVVAWITAHPVAAGAVIFAIAFCDALVVAGIVVPALPLLFAVGALVGLGHVNGPYAILCAAAGAFAGDALSYWIGRRWGRQLRSRWPFSRYPDWLDRGESLFRRRGVQSIFIARFVGAVRPFVPAIAGMLHMPLRRYALPSAIACVLWAASFLAPGWVLGKSYDAVAAVADRLALALGALALAVGIAWAVVLYTWRWFALHADSLLVRILRWARAHPRLARWVMPLVDPNRPESPSLLMLAASLLGISWIWFTLLAALLASGGPLGLDHSIHEAMTRLRNPLADRLMAALASLGDAAVLGPAAAIALAYLVWRKRYMAAGHWLAALMFGLVLTTLLERVIDMPRPSTAPDGFGFPSIAVTMTTITFGFFAVLIARELPGRRRVWPYLLAGVLTTVVGFARLYLGAHWPSDIVGGTLFGFVWLLVLGLAYRRHVQRSFWMRPVAYLFYGTFVVAALLHAPRAADRILVKFSPVLPTTLMTRANWWDAGWTRLPAQRDERDLRRRWPLNVQVAGPLAPLQATLQARGWRVQPQATWEQTVGLLDDDIPAARQPVLPATLDTQAEALLLLRPGARADEQVALRLWRAPVTLADGLDLWIGTAQTLRLETPFGAAALWRPVEDGGRARHLVRDAMDGYQLGDSAHPGGGHVLRIRSDARVDPVPAASGDQ